MDVLGALRAFVRITETGSFSAVARESNASQSAVTRQIAQLEQHFAVRLFHRTTRRLSLTDDGEVLLTHARHLIEATDEMESALGRQRAGPRGLGRPWWRVVSHSLAGRWWPRRCTWNAMARRRRPRIWRRMHAWSTTPRRNRMSG